MSTVLSNLKLKESRSGQHPASVGAILSYNEMVKDVLPPIVQELEEKISILQETVNELMRLIKNQKKFD
jgi:hypothetical protein